MLLLQMVVVGGGENVGTFTSEQVYLKAANGTIKEPFLHNFPKFFFYNYIKEGNGLVYSLENFSDFKCV